MSDNTAGPGRCNAQGCGTPCDGFMCAAHWKLVPPAMRLAIESSPDPRSAESPISQAAIAEVAHRESRSKSRGSSGIRKEPVQLALFGDDQVVLAAGKRR